MVGKKRKPISAAQYSLLVGEMKRYNQRAPGALDLRGIRKFSEEKWDEISNKLNSIGPPCKRTFEWRRVWSDLKRNTKKKLGYSTAGSSLLNVIEKEVLDVINAETNAVASENVSNEINRNNEVAVAVVSGFLYEPEVEISTFDNSDTETATSGVSTCDDSGIEKAASCSNVAKNLPREQDDHKAKRKSDDGNEFLVLIREQTTHHENISNVLERIADTMEMIANLPKRSVHRKLNDLTTRSV